MSENARPEHVPVPVSVSVDDALYAIADGEWTRVGFAGKPRAPDAKPFSLPEGHVSVDGAVYATVDGEWKHVGSTSTRRPDRPSRAR